VILLSHLGIQLDRAIARYSPVHIDAIVGGHDHFSLVETVSGVPIVHAGSYYRQIGKIRLAVGASGVSLASAELVEVDQKVRRPLPSESLVAATVSGVQAFVDHRWPAITRPDLYPSFFHTPIAVAAGKITNEIDLDRPKRDSGTGNLVTDALRWRMGTDVAFTVSGQTPEGIAEGPIVCEDLFRVVGLGFDGATGFGWRLATLLITGAELLKALETTIDASLSDDDYVLQVSGMEYVYDSRRARGERLVSVTVGGAPLDPSGTYTATVNALLWAMLPKLDVKPLDGGLTGDFEFTALRDYVIAAGTVAASGTNRVRDLAARGDARR
jgi:2',3'-cyclic-nucleotide 2'-phosphodiesterase (5'-nucleotidase family)